MLLGKSMEIQSKDEYWSGLIRQDLLMAVMNLPQWAIRTLNALQLDVKDFVHRKRC
jgi:hypothetical protein